MCQRKIYIPTVVICFLDNTPDIVVKSLLDGGAATRGVSHRHLLPLIAAHASDLEQPMLLYPKTAYGTLKSMLLQSREVHKGVTHGSQVSHMT